MRKSALFVFLFSLSCFWLTVLDASDFGIGSGAGSDTNLFAGQDAGLEGDDNTLYGKDAGAVISSGIGDTFIGLNAGISTTSGSYNTFLGSAAGYFNTTAGSNTYIGFAAGRNSTAGGNSFVGASAGFSNTTGNSNAFFGQNAGYSNTTGSANTFLGYYAGYSNTSVSSNTFIGHAAGRNSTGSDNTFVGASAGFSNTAGNSNTFFGESAGYGNTSGICNTILGKNAGYFNTTGSGNIFLGYESGEYEPGSNKLYIDNSSTSTPLIYGDFNNDIVTIYGKLGVGTKTPGYPVEVSRTGANASIVLNRTDGAKNYVNATASFGNFGTVNNFPLRLTVNSAARMTLHTDSSLSMASGATCTAGGVWTNASSLALKENITALNSDEAAATLQSLNPVKYNYKAVKEESHVGFIAEEVPELVAMKDRKSLSPMDIVAVLTRVTQDQQSQLQEQKQQLHEQFQFIQQQQRINERLQMEIAELKTNR